ncbi:hypothetical protein [Puniceibacterium sediminis]|uniref:Uncharacterized protein n=1 Tax=Puniceibacterium sediminis TaxID=1608407 RepID=A0A238VGW2_9RHOB|nr:hypothetical protein [Puniceibacterium sediminis]SNR33635.1 hypothetical protein SAMN06265370_102161 [Puniceibacterium sediminis]
MPLFTRPVVTMIAQVLLCLSTSAAQAAVLTGVDPLSQNLGEPVHQQFLPSGASVVTTHDTKSCVVSQRIEIENSVYLDAKGDQLDFDRIVRSPATSVQAVATEAGEISFRIQLKYSVAEGTPIILALKDRVLDLQESLEKSTDSLLMTGDTAVLIAAAFRDGVVATLSSVSLDTGHSVSDTLLAPDLAALEACALDLPSGSELDAEVDNVIRLHFTADPETTPLATLPDLRACRMDDEPGLLHLAKLESVTGFYSQTDKIFVAFNEDGTLGRAYIPGIFDGDFGEFWQSARLSRAADSNVPTAANDVKGCLGSAEIHICSSPTEDGAFTIGPCLGGDMLDMFPDATGFVPELAGLSPSLYGPSGVTRATSGDLRPGRSGGRSPTSIPPTENPPVIITTPGSVPPTIKTPTPTDPKGGDIPIISPVPLPAGLLLMLGAFMALLLVSRRAHIAYIVRSSSF